MKYVEKYCLFEIIKGTGTDEPYPPKQNDFGGIAPGGISLFEQDVEPSEGGMDSIPGYNFTMCSTKNGGVWTLEGELLHLLCIGGSPFGREDYSLYLSKTLNKYALNMLKERCEHYGLEEKREGILMLGINDTFRVLQARPEHGLYYVVYPDGDVEMTTNFNNTLRAESTVNRIEKHIGHRLYLWLRAKFRNLAPQ